MSNPKIKIFVTDSQIHFLILWSVGDEEESKLDFELRKVMTNAFGALGEDFGEKNLLGSKRIAWDITNHKEDALHLTNYKLHLNFSFQKNSLKFEDYRRVIKGFSSSIEVEEFAPHDIKRPLRITEFKTSSSKFAEQIQLNISSVLKSIYDLSVSSPVLAAMSGGAAGGGAGAALPAVLSTATESDSEEEGGFLSYAVQAPAAVVLAIRSSAATIPPPLGASRFFLPAAPPPSLPAYTATNTTTEAVTTKPATVS